LSGHLVPSFIAAAAAGYCSNGRFNTNKKLPIGSTPFYYLVGTNYLNQGMYECLKVSISWLVMGWFHFESDFTSFSGSLIAVY
jgi:hypothetical protein